MTERVCNKREEEFDWWCESGLDSVDEYSERSERDDVPDECEGRIGFVAISDE